MPNLQDYLTDTRYLLHDSAGNYWSDAELTSYINEARNKVVGDTGCNRSLQVLPTVTKGVEVYNYSSFPIDVAQGMASTIDVLNVTLLWGNSRIVLGQMSFSEFNARFRTYQNLESRPIAFAKYGQSSIYLGPSPDQTYSIELDTVVLPKQLAGLADVCILNFPYTSPVPYHAAYRAKYKEQSFAEANNYHQEYILKCKEALVQTLTRVIPTMYSAV